jgi:hypothetical protein
MSKSGDGNQNMNAKNENLTVYFILAAQGSVQANPEQGLFLTRKVRRALLNLMPAKGIDGDSSNVLFDTIQDIKGHLKVAEEGASGSVVLSSMYNRIRVKGTESYIKRDLGFDQIPVQTVHGSVLDKAVQTKLISASNKNLANTLVVVGDEKNLREVFAKCNSGQPLIDIPEKAKSVKMTFSDRSWDVSWGPVFEFLSGKREAVTVSIGEGSEIAVTLG